MRVAFWLLYWIFVLAGVCYAEDGAQEDVSQPSNAIDNTEAVKAMESSNGNQVAVNNPTTVNDSMTVNDATTEADDAALKDGIMQLGTPSPANDARPGDYPWIVGYTATSLKHNKTGDFEYWSDHCGGTLIAPLWVLTVAHCFGREYHPSNFTVFAGGVNYERRDADYQYRGVTQIAMPDEFHMRDGVPDGDILHRSPYYEYDVALMRLEREFDMSGAQVAVAGFSFSRIDGTKQCKIFGWGELVLTLKTEEYLEHLEVPPSKIDFPNHLNKTLRYKEVLVKSTDQCAREFDTPIPKSIICVTSTTTPTNPQHLRTCVGDPGLPVVCARTDQPHVTEIVGVSLWTKQYLRCMTETPHYLWLGAHADWINRHMTPQDEGLRLRSWQEKEVKGVGNRAMGVSMGMNGYHCVLVFISYFLLN